uniref:Uncharacterized protein n=1 Tax=Arundo donax TaxID=35708 RepID=A0A0A8ZZM0_ARUDO
MMFLIRGAVRSVLGWSPVIARMRLRMLVSLSLAKMMMTISSWVLRPVGSALCAESVTVRMRMSVRLFAWLDLSMRQRLRVRMTMIEFRFVKCS